MPCTCIILIAWWSCILLVSLKWMEVVRIVLILITTAGSAMMTASSVTRSILA